MHIHRSTYLTGPEAEFANDVPVPSNHRCAFTLHDLYPGRVYPLPRTSSSGIGVANQQPDPGSRASSPSDEDISPTNSVRDIAQRFQETGGKRLVAPRQEDLRRKGIPLSTVVEEQEQSAAAAVPPIDMTKVRQHKVASDKQCERCATISPASFWNQSLCPSFMGSCPMCQMAEEDRSPRSTKNLARCIYVQGYHCSTCSKLINQEVKEEMCGIEDAPTCD